MKSPLITLDKQDKNRIFMDRMEGEFLDKKDKRFFRDTTIIALVMIISFFAAYFLADSLFVYEARNDTAANMSKELGNTDLVAFINGSANLAQLNISTNQTSKPEDAFDLQAYLESMPFNEHTAPQRRELSVTRGYLRNVTLYQHQFEWRLIMVEITFYGEGKQGMPRLYAIYPEDLDNIHFPADYSGMIEMETSPDSFEKHKGYYITRIEPAGPAIETANLNEVYANNSDLPQFVVT